MNTFAYFALDWISDNLHRFNPLYNNTAVPYPQYQTALAELSLLCYQFDNSNIKIPEIDRYITFIEEVYSEPTMYMYPFNVDNRAFIGHLIIWLTLNHRGIKHPITKERMQGFINDSKLISIGRPAFRNLELRYFLEKGDFIHDMEDDEKIFQKTCLGNTLEVPDNYPNMYDITHTIFYLTDFGRCHCNILSDIKEKIIELINQMIDIATKTGNWDLLSELILSYHCMKLQKGIETEKMLKVIQSAQDSEGFIPGFGFSKDELRALPDKETQAEFLFLRCYHPTLASVMTGFLKNDELIH